MAKDNRLSKIISNQDKYEFGLITTAPTDTTKQYINSMRDNNINSSTGFTFGQICEALQGREDYICGVTSNVGDALEYSDRNIGYCLKPNEDAPSNVAIWRSFWNEIGDGVDENIGKYPVILSGYNYDDGFNNDIETLNVHYFKDMSFSGQDDYNNLDICDIKPIDKHSKSFSVASGDTCAIRLSGDITLRIYIRPSDEEANGLDPKYESMGDVIMSDWTHNGEHYQFNSGIFYIVLYDENKNEVKRFSIGTTRGDNEYLNRLFDITLSYTNTSSSVKNIKYFKIIADEIEVYEAYYTYNVYDLMSGNVIRYMERSDIFNFDINFTSNVNISFEGGSTDAEPFTKTNDAIYIIPHKCYEVHLNDEWMRGLQTSLIVPEGSSVTYDGPYISFSNSGIANSGAKMFIDIHGYDTFKLYIKSYGENFFDYVMVSQLDQEIEYNTGNNSTNVKASTYGKSNSGNDISNYTLVTFDNIGGGDHRITVIYRKDSTKDEFSDCGYVVIPEGQEKYSYVRVKGARYNKFWGSDNDTYLSNAHANYSTASLERTNDCLIKATKNSYLYAYQYNIQTGKFIKNTYSYTSTAVCRFMSNYYNIVDRLKSECNKTSFTTPCIGYTKYDSSYKCFHIGGGYMGTYNNSVPMVNCDNIFDINMCSNTMFDGVTGSGLYIAVFYPGRTKDTGHYGSDLTSNTHYGGYQNEKKMVYIVPATTSIVDRTAYIKAYAAQGGQSSQTWGPIINSTSSITLTNVNGDSLQYISLYPAYNNIVIVQNNTSASTPTKTIDVYKYHRTTGEYIGSTRYISFGA